MEWEKKDREAINRAFELCYDFDEPTINKMIEMLQVLRHDKRFGNLLRKFRTDKANARDFWFEIMIAYQLTTQRVENLTYEGLANDETLEDCKKNEKKSDFQFDIGNCHYDLEVKRQYSGRFFLFDRICELIINANRPSLCFGFKTTEDFTEDYYHAFIKDLKVLIKNCKLCNTVEEYWATDFYTWRTHIESSYSREAGGLYYDDSYDWMRKPPISFSFIEKEGECPRVWDASLSNFTTTPLLDPEIRSKIQGNLNKSSGQFRNSVSATQANIAIIQSAGYDNRMNEVTMAKALYGDPLDAKNGLFYDKNNSFPKISGVILATGLPSTIKTDLKGFYYSHPMHKDYTKHYKIPFPKVIDYESI